MHGNEAKNKVEIRYNCSSSLWPSGRTTSEYFPKHSGWSYTNWLRSAKSFLNDTPDHSRRRRFAWSGQGEPAAATTAPRTAGEYGNTLHAIHFPLRNALDWRQPRAPLKFGTLTNIRKWAAYLSLRLWRGPRHTCVIVNVKSYYNEHNNNIIIMSELARQTE